jgi:hypothetical protein
LASLFEFFDKFYQFINVTEKYSKDVNYVDEQLRIPRKFERRGHYNKQNNVNNKKHTTHSLSKRKVRLLSVVLFQPTALVCGAVGTSTTRERERGSCI